MDVLTWARSPRGEDILAHISWDLLTRSTIAGWITRRQYPEHHDPDRRAVRGREMR